MEYFSPRLTKVWVLNRLYRYAMTIYPGYAFQRFGTVTGNLERLGSNYGGWYAPTSEIGPDAIVYSAGLGLDITFDKALIDRCGCDVYGFDPTPASVVYIAKQFEEQALSPKFRFAPVGLWDSETTLQFFAPKTRGWIGSYSALNLQGSADEEAISVPVKRLSTLMRENGHAHIDLLKMDIEGAEYRVIDEVLSNNIPVCWLCIEFDQPIPFWTTNRALGRLRDAGYQLCKVDRWNFVFQNRQLLKATVAA
ncbi:MAG: FkbM family methyltransferase [Propionivibrio sp.]